MGPAKRSKTQPSEAMAVAATPVSTPDQVTAPLVGALANLDDASTLYGKEAKELRGAATEALVNVWRDARQSTSQLGQQFSQGNSNLFSGLNDSFAAVSSRIEALPMVASCSPDGQIPKVHPFSGSGENVAQFSIRLRRLEDIVRMRGGPMSSEQKANFLIGHLDGVAREKIEELSEDDKKSFEAIVGHLRGFFESPQQRYVARQTLAACRQEPGESSTIFANRSLNLVRAARAGQDPLTQKEKSSKSLLLDCEATIAARQALSSRETVVVTASTNAAVAQFAETLLSVEEFAELVILRYVSDTAMAEERSALPVDLKEVLKSLGDNFAARLRVADRTTCARFRAGRLRYEQFAQQENLELSDHDREEFILAEKDVSETLEDIISIMFAVRPPNVLCITTASLLNASDEKGIFAGHWDNFSLLICDEASQVPEPVFVATANRFPHVYIGDIHQLEPHVRCPRNSNPAKFGARSVIALLVAARAVPTAPLVTTFRAHPLLNGLPNTVAYDGTLISGAIPEQRSMLLNLVMFLDGETPFLFPDVARNSERATSRSHFNEAEATVCTSIIDRLMGKGVSPASICIISFYKEQLRRLEDYAARVGVELGTVDSVQGREKDIVILLTTRTDFNPLTAEFLNDPRRMNVALTHCRHEQFVLGHVESLRRVNFWSVVLTWAAARNAIVPAEDLGSYLSTV